MQTEKPRSVLGDTLDELNHQVEQMSLGDVVAELEQLDAKIVRVMACALVGAVPNDLRAESQTRLSRNRRELRVLVERFKRSQVQG